MMGDMQPANGAPSKLHSKVEFASEEVNASCAALTVLFAAGCCVIVVSGGAGVATTFDAGLSAVPLAPVSVSVTMILKVWFSSAVVGVMVSVVAPGTDVQPAPVASQRCH